MKRLLTIIALSTGLAAGPVLADHDGNPILNKENVGGALGAALGGFAGSKIVDGDGRPAATAAGAVGGFLLGKNIAHNYNSGGRYGTSHRVYGHRSGRHYHKQRYREARLRPIHDTYMARTTSNVRAGPGTRYAVIDQLYRREQVRVVGKVRGRDWYMVRLNGQRGFVYAPLLKPAHYYSDGGYSDYGDRYQQRSSRTGWYR